MNIQEKINEVFAGKVVRKDLTKDIKSNAVVPSYVLEYLLGQYCASDDDDIIREGVSQVKRILANHFVSRDEAEIIKHTVKSKGHHKVIDKVAVKLNERKDIYEAGFSNLRIKKVPISDEIIKANKKLLTSGVWCIVNLGYEADENESTPWIIDSLKPIQISQVNLEEYKEARREFSTEAWLDLLIQSMGLNPEHFNFRSKLLQLVRLIPFCENNYNLIELGPKGTGKSHIYSELSPHGILISGSEVTQAKLFVNNSTGQIGLVGFWDTVAFDEFGGFGKKVEKGLVDILKNYMANKTFSRGTDVYSASASMAYVGNTEHSLEYMMKKTNLFDSLPPQFYDSAFLDRVHAYIPGWEVSKLRTEMFTDKSGFIVDYLAEILRELRKEDFSGIAGDHFTLSDNLTTRDRDGIVKTFNGLLKILYPNKDIPQNELKPLFEFSIELRKRVKNQLLKMDDTFEEVSFSFIDNDDNSEHHVKTLEELSIETPFDVSSEAAHKSDTKKQSYKNQVLKEKQKRLIRVAKEFNIGHNTIVEFLANKGFEIESNPNTKVPTECYELLEKEFGDQISVKAKFEAVSQKTKDTDKTKETTSHKQENAKPSEQNAEKSNNAAKKETSEAVHKSDTKKQSDKNQALEEKQVSIYENQTGVSYRKLFADYLENTHEITIADPYIRYPYQIKNLMEFCSLVAEVKPSGKEVAVELITYYNEEYKELAEKAFEELRNSLASLGVYLTVDFNETQHDRYLDLDNGWKINLGRGLDIFQKPVSQFDISEHYQEKRQCKSCEITFMRKS